MESEDEVYKTLGVSLSAISLPSRAAGDTMFPLGPVLGLCTLFKSYLTSLSYTIYNIQYPPQRVLANRVVVLALLFQNSGQPVFFLAALLGEDPYPAMECIPKVIPHVRTAALSHPERLLQGGGISNVSEHCFSRQGSSSHRLARGGHAWLHSLSSAKGIRNERVVPANSPTLYPTSSLCLSRNCV